MPYDNLDRLIAFAGLHQAAACVTRIAHRGSAEAEMMEPCIYSLLQVDAESTAAVFGAPGALAPGARQVIAQLTGQPERNLELTRYVVTLIRLERALAREPGRLARLGEGIEAARAKLEHFPLLHPAILGHFADLYSETISTLTPRVMVQGSELHLGNPDNQSRVRALLLAGIRAAMLWRQVGGSRWHLLLRNRQILDDARAYLERHED
ncbi:high frequency lysogenization protein HflD [Marichromatium gracile]|uniref:High frequency lysogenization protein HflD homolog n=1 Tax=Marichromatium gracile TaxID=1048 RepID=A0ABR5VIJ9_MARGR|nr:high frequency lysogenization protein HflD [Marichromatium gracile]KXX65309.1 High frequency lysogenization protein hflD [Marichromatium gracile]